ncbi:MAG TPA: GDP-mannose 4,6-dehydratase [Bacteroidales bacterium]|nr:GDP-mannose 4,6-dehydratase [Bacteroidales bacterium]
MKRLISTKLPSLKGAKILITGGLGFIGSNLSHKCLQLGADVTIYDSLALNSGGNLANIEDIKNEVKLIFSDILDFNEVVHAIYNKDIIFNCAASTSHPQSMNQPVLDMDVNNKGLLFLLEASKRFNNKIKFIHLGTSTQLGSLRYKPADEEHPEFPTDIYSANKSVSEKYAIIYSRAFNMDISVIRLSNVYGPRACIKSSNFTFNNYFIGLSLQDKQITIYGDGKQLRNFIYIDDVVSALILASQNENTRGEVFFAVGDEHFSVAEMAEMIVKVFKSGSIKYINWPSESKAIEIGDAVISNKKIKKFLSWEPETTLRNGLKITKDFYLNNLHNYL